VCCACCVLYALQVSFANARSYGNKNVDYIPSQKPAKVGRKDLTLKWKGDWRQLLPPAGTTGLNPQLPECHMYSITRCSSKCNRY
jgi:hypothetical protein